MSGQTNHIVAYVKQQYVSTWKHITFNYDPGGQPAYFYGSNDCSHFTRLKPGDVLWVIQSHKENPPSLVARLKIKDIFFDVVKRKRLTQKIQRGFRTRQFLIQGDPNDCVFFGHNDASEALFALHFSRNRKFKVPGKKKTTIESPWQFKGHLIPDGKRWDPSEGIHLLRPCFIAAGDYKTDDSRGVQPLKELAESILANTVFISYKHDAFKRKAQRLLIEDLIRILLGEGFAVWWDRYAIPRYKPKRRNSKSREQHNQTQNQVTEEEHDQALNRILKQGLIQSRGIVGLVSKNYGQPPDEESTNWTLQEWQANNYKRILYEIDQQPKGTLENLKHKLNPKPNLPLAYCNLKKAAREIRRCLAKQKKLDQ